MTRFLLLLMLLALPVAVAGFFLYEEKEPELTHIRSANGILDTTLVATKKKIDLDGVVINAAVYNGQYAGPVLHVQPGDIIRIQLINHTSRQINIHYHGFETSPLNNGDNIHIGVKPGETFHYEIKVAKYQAPGLYWYHDHTHGISEKNVMDGLSGAIIVEGFAEQFPALSGVKEHIMVLKDYQFPDTQDPNIIKNFHRVIQTINGKTNIKIHMNPGETQLWRFSNQSADRLYHIAVKGMKFRIIAVDGRHVLHEIPTDVLEIPQAVRVEALVTAEKEGTFDLITQHVPTGAGLDYTLDRVQGQIIVSGAPVKSVQEITSFSTDSDLRTQKMDELRTIVFSQIADEKGDIKYFMNGKQYEKNRIDMRIPLGNTEEWTIRNDSDDYHVFHIHQVHFQVIDRNGKPQPLNGYVDNVGVPARETAKIIIPFTDPVIVGKFVMHCHVLEHEDKGMMMHVEVYDPNNKGVYPFFRAGKDSCKSDTGQPLDPNNAQYNSCSDSSVGGGFTLTNQDGKQVSDKDFRGKYMLVFFGFTHCPDVCPVTLQTISQAMKESKAKDSDIAPLFVTTDPQQDTPAVMKSYLASFSFPITGLTGSTEEVKKLESEYKVYASKVEDKDIPSGYSFDHSGYIYLMDRNGQYVTAFTADSSAHFIAAQISKYLDKDAHK